MMGVGPSRGALVGTLQPMPMCASRIQAEKIAVMSLALESI